MGERTSGMKPEQIEHEVESIRAGIEPVIDELDHRRHDLVERATQIRRQAPGIMRKVMLTMAVVTAVRTFLRMRSSRRKQSRRARAF